MMNFKKIFLVLLSIGTLILSVPMSLEVLSRSIEMRPIYDSPIKDNKNYKIFLKHFTHNFEQAVSVYNLKLAKKTALYAFLEANRTDISPDEQQKLSIIGNQLMVYLQKYYPFDAYLMLRKAEFLTNQKQFVQGYNSLLASYSMSVCYAPILNYRILLKQKYNLFIADKINNDIDYIKNNNCNQSMS